MGPDYVDLRVFDPTHLTIGFARRLATSKRRTCWSASTGVRMLRDAARPIQLVIAGKRLVAEPAARLGTSGSTRAARGGLAARRRK